MITFTPHGVCSREIQYSVKDGKIEEIRVLGGCDGNLKGLCTLLRGMPVKQAVERLKGIDCRGKGTSCPDQIAIALSQELKD